MKVGKSIWYAKRVSDNNSEVNTYSTPEKITTRFNYLTVMPASSRGYLEVLKFGEAIYDTWTAIANGKIFDGKFNEGDLMWVDGHAPNENLEELYGNGATANAIIKSVAENNHTISIVLHTNQNEIKR